MFFFYINLIIYLRLQTRLLLFDVVDLDDEGLDLLLLLLDADGVFAADLLDLLSAGGSLGLVLGLPVLHLTVGLDDLAFQVQTSLGLFLELDTDGFQVNLDLDGQVS